VCVCVRVCVFLHVCCYADLIMTFEWGSAGKGEGQFNWPKAIVIGLYNRLYLFDDEGKRIQCFDTKGEFIQSWMIKGREEKVPTWNDRFHRAYMALGPCMFLRENVTLAMIQVHALAQFPPGVLPICIAYLGDECLYINNDDNNHVLVMTTDGRYLREWHTEIESCEGITVASSTGMLYIVGLKHIIGPIGNSRKQQVLEEYSSEGKLQCTTPLRADCELSSIAISIADQRFFYCTFHTAFSAPWDGSEPCDWNCEYGWRIVPRDGYVYIFCRPRTIRKFSYDGTLVQEWPCQRDCCSAVISADGIWYSLDSNSSRIEAIPLLS
jgi:hypothetical protein